MNRLIVYTLIALTMFCAVLSAQVKQFYWKVGADGKAIPYKPGYNINLDSAGVYSRDSIDALLSGVVRADSSRLTFVDKEYTFTGNQIIFGRGDGNSGGSTYFQYLSADGYNMHLTTPNRGKTIFVTWPADGGSIAVREDTATLTYTRYKTDSLVDANTFDPTKDYQFYEDFDVGNQSTGTVGSMKWGMYGGGLNHEEVYDTTALNVPGVFRLTAGTGVGNSYAQIYNPVYSTGASAGSLVGTQPFTLKMRVKNKASAVKGKKLWFGLAENYDTPSVGIYFYVDSVGYHCVTNNGVSKDSTTTYSQTGNWVTFKIVSTGSSVGFYANDTLISTNTTNIPSTGMKYVVNIKSLEAVTNKSVLIDYFWCRVKGLTR